MTPHSITTCRDLETMIVKQPDAYPNLLRMCGITDVREMTRIVQDLEETRNDLQLEAHILTGEFVEKSRQLEVSQKEKDDYGLAMPGIKQF